MANSVVSANRERRIEGTSGAPQVFPVKPSAHAQVPSTVHTPPLEHAGEQPRLWTSRMSSPPLPAPDGSCPVSYTDSHSTSRLDLSLENRAIVNVSGVRRSDATSCGDRKAAVALAAF